MRFVSCSLVFVCTSCRGCAARREAPLRMACVDFSNTMSYFGGLILALLGTSLPVAQVAPASTGNITPVGSVPSACDPDPVFGIDRDHTCHPSRLISRQKPHSSTNIPACPLCLQQTAILPRLPRFLGHTTRIHHRRVHHTRTNAIDSDTLRRMMHSHPPCHILSNSVSNQPIVKAFF